MKTIPILPLFLFFGTDMIAQANTEVSAKDEKRALKRAQKLRKRLLRGADFIEFAKKYSDDPGSAQYGGELGQVHFGQLVPEYDSVVLTLEVGEISNPVRTDFGYHLIELIAKDETTFNSRHILIKP